ncbi:MAG: multicopper oxidase domain-containing protein [Anaerolineae bacterium]|nr:multicopper oxidase domain-containing protein [Anaerolineae bacterium]
MASHTLSRREFIRMIGMGGAGFLATSVLGACALTGSVMTNQPLSEQTPDVEIALQAVEDDIQIFPGAATKVWRYQGELINGPLDALQNLPESYLGPVFRLRTGQRLRVHFSNKLREETIVHWHGLHVPQEADGHPRLVIQSGETYVYDFTVMDRAGTYWYHPHPHGRTGPQVYYGLAGLFLVSDDEETGLELPQNDYDLPLVIQDRTFDSANQLAYSRGGMMTGMMGFLGNQILVNGQPNYRQDVGGRPYRLRLLNGSNSRIYPIAWEDGSPLTVIGTDGGLLDKPVMREFITLAPAQRIELWVDFATWAESSVALVNRPSAAPGSAESFPIMTFRVGLMQESLSTLPNILSPLKPLAEGDAINHRFPRDFTLAMGRGMIWTINGKLFEMTKVARNETVKLGDLEVWRFSNQAGGGMGMMGGMSLPHPIHIHGLQFYVLDRNLDPSIGDMWSSLSNGCVDAGWHDTVLVMPGEQVKILLKFEDYTGLYLYHCHNLEHEDMGMMRNYRVVA